MKSGIIPAAQLPGLISYFPLDKSAFNNTLAASFFSGAYGTVGGTQAWQDGPLVPGIFPSDGATKFGGTDFLTLNTFPLPVGGTGLTRFSISGWVYINSVSSTGSGGGSQRILNFGDNVNNAVNICNDESQPGGCVFTVQVAGTTSVCVGTTQVFSNNTWAFVTATWDGTNALIYINGALKSTTGQNFGLNIAASYFGQRTGSLGNLAGSLAHFALFSRALNREEVSALYNAYTSSPTGEMPALYLAPSGIVLTGIGMTSGAGSLAKVAAISLPGASSSIAAGNLSIGSNQTVNLVGASVTATAGALIEAITKALTGAGVTAAPGSLLPIFNTFVLPGVGATAAAGSFVPVIGAALTGAGLTSGAGSLAAAIVIPLPGASMVIATVGVEETLLILASSSTGMTSGAGTFSTGSGGSVSLIGAGATATAGALATMVADALTGASLSSGAGLFVPTVLIALPSASLASAAGILSVGAAGSVPLIGASLSSAAGSFTDAIVRALVGAGAASNAGILTPLSGLVVPLTGAGISSGAGTLANAIAEVLAGAGLVSGAGIIPAAPSILLPGVSLTSGAGSLVKQIACALTGASLSSGAGILVPTGAVLNIPLVGVSMQIRAGILTVHLTLPTPAQRIAIVQGELRLVTVPAQARIVITAAETTLVGVN